MNTINPNTLRDELLASETGPGRILIGGWPRTGKSGVALWLGATLGILVRATDDLVGTFEWSALSEEVSTWFDEVGPWIVEGTPMARAVRKWLARNPTGLPADRILWAPKPLVELTKGQAAMGKGCDTVWGDVYAELRRRGARVELLEVPFVAEVAAAAQEHAP